MKNNCIQCNTEFIITDGELALYDKVGIPPARECYACRMIRQGAFWNFGKFRKTESALSGKSIITVWPESVEFPIYTRDEWISDDWDAMDYGKDYDFTRSFFEQFGELQKAVPHSHQLGTKNIACEWADDVWESKNCYLCRALLGCEDLSYGYRTVHCKNSIDLTYCFNMEISYDCTYCFRGYKLRHSFDSRDCVDSMFLYDCRNVQNSFMCWNLRNKQYHILNEPYSKEEYYEKLKEFNTNSYEGIRKLKEEFHKNIREYALHKQNHNVNSTNSSGDYLDECKECFQCYNLEQSENCFNIIRGLDNKDVIDGFGFGMAEKGAMCIGMHFYDVVGLSWCTNCRYTMYSDTCEDCEYCFGCVGLRKKKYCILNKQYTKEEYEELLPKIKEHLKSIGEWGLFFPISLGYGGYNFTVGNMYFPLTQDEVRKREGKWDIVEDETHNGLSGNDVPDLIDDVPEDFHAQAIVCSETGWRFNIAKHEVEFYKAHNIPIPRHHPDHRTMQRFGPLSVVQEYEETCDICSKSIVHYYPPEWGYKHIVCTECYQKEVA